MDIEKIFIKNIKKYNMISNNDKIVIGLSGGADSVALLTLVLKYIEVENISVKIICVHINHNIREDSYLDQKLCNDYCESKGVELFIKNIDLYKLKEEYKLSIEETGRILRYEIFNNIFKDEYKIFLGHNKDDNAETFLLNLLRGAGTKGLCAMTYTSGNLYRPLLNITKEDIYIYLKTNNICYREDYTNGENIYNRNIIRNQVFPLLKTLNKKALSNIERTQNILKEEDLFLDELANKELENLIENDNSLSLMKFNKINIVIKKRILRLYIDKICTLKDISFLHIESIIELSENKKGMRYLSLPNDFIVKVYNDKLIICKKEENIIEENLLEDVVFNKIIKLTEYSQFLFITFEKLVDFQQSYENELCKFKLKVVKYKEFSYNNSYDIVLRNRLPKDNFYLNTIKGHKKLKNYFIDEKVPKDMRDKIPLLAIKNSDDVLWVLDEKGIANDKFKPNKNDKRVYIYILEEK
ncbi:MAG: tRNA lysidine(34) synthetase TilS [Lachnospirales bacterium]